MYTKITTHTQTRTFLCIYIHMYTYMCIYIYIYTYICIYVYIYMFVHASVCVCTCLFACVDEAMFVSVCTKLSASPGPHFNIQESCSSSTMLLRTAASRGAIASHWDCANTRQTVGLGSAGGLEPRSGNRTPSHAPKRHETVALLKRTAIYRGTLSPQMPRPHSKANAGEASQAQPWRGCQGK